MTRSRVICVVGPTASGKSELSELVARMLDGEIVSIDAMQVYRGMDIGTAKTPAGQRTCPMHMIDVADVDEQYSVTRFQRDARTCVDDIVSRGRVAVLCGGTGLYLDAVVDELTFPTDNVNHEARRTYESYAQEYGADKLHELLRQRDENSAALIHAHNVRRVIRALEMADMGMSYAEQNKGLKKHVPHYDATLYGIDLDRAMLYQRIDARVDRMFDAGLVTEVSGLLDHGLRSSTTASQAIGYKETIQAIDGQITFEKARELIKRNTRRYAKRQLSWLRRDGRVRWVTADGRQAIDMARDIVRDWSAS